MLLAHMTLSDKPFMGAVTEPRRAQGSVEMCETLFVKSSLININSPLTFDDVMLGALEVYARSGQACIISQFGVGGAMVPVVGTGISTATGRMARKSCASPVMAISTSRWRGNE